MLASIGAATSRGLLVKGGKYLELLSRADVLLIDKTRTVTADLDRSITFNISCCCLA